jgi:glycogenin glucosyltransferase
LKPDPVAEIVQYHVQGEFQPPVESGPSQSKGTECEPFQPTTEGPLHETTEIPQEIEVAYVPPVETHAAKEKDREFSYSSWDARKLVVRIIETSALTITRTPPPAKSKGEAEFFPTTHYDMSSDPSPFKAPERYPDPPKNMYYEVPKTPTYQKPAPIFPWEKDAPKATRVFPEDVVEVEASETITAPAPVEDEKLSPVKLTAPTIKITPADSWQTFSRGNAWDDIPEIERYIGNLQKNRKGNIQVLQGYGSGIEQMSSPGARRQSMKLTDFPTELERPSLPVTPAPIRRPSFWGEERDEEGELPAAEGVPSQEDWVSLILSCKLIY